MQTLLNHAVGRTTDVLEKVDDPEDACLLVIGQKSFPSVLELFRNPHWKGGQNHYIFDSSKLFGALGDRPFNDKVHFGMAAYGMVSTDDAHLREGYDMPIGFFPRWFRSPQFSDLTVHRPRRLLLSFKGNIFDWEQRNWQHRSFQLAC